MASSGRVTTISNITNSQISAAAAIELIKNAAYAVGLRSNGATSLANGGATTAVAFGSQLFLRTPSGYMALHSTSSNNTRITAGKTGLYVFAGIVGYAADVTGNYRGALIRKNGSTSLGGNNVRPVGGGAGTTALIFAFNYMTATDYVELGGLHDGDAAINAASGESYLYAALLAG